MRLGLYIRTCTKVVHRTIRVAVDDFSRCPGSYSFHASALNLPDSLRSTRGVIHPYSAVPEAIATNLKGCLNSEVNLSLWHGGQESNLRLQLGLFTLLSVNLANHILYGCRLASWLPPYIGARGGTWTHDHGIIRPKKIAVSVFYKSHNTCSANWATLA